MARIAILGPDQKLITTCILAEAARYLTVKGAKPIKSHGGKLVAISMPTRNHVALETLSHIESRDFKAVTKRTPSHGGLVNPR